MSGTDGVKSSGTDMKCNTMDTACRNVATDKHWRSLAGCYNFSDGLMPYQWTRVRSQIYLACASMMQTKHDSRRPCLPNSIIFAITIDIIVA